MDTNGSEGFFPEREVLRARRLGAVADRPVDSFETRNRRAAVWMTLSIAIFLPMFINTVTFGRNAHLTPASLQVIKYSLWLLLAGCAVCVAVGLWRSLRSPITR